MSALDEAAAAIVSDVFDALLGEPVFRRVMEEIPLGKRASLALSLVPIVRARLTVSRLPMYRDILPLCPVGV